jgi:hypothetical protein
MTEQLLVWAEMRRWYREDAAVPLVNRVAMWAAFAVLFAVAAIGGQVYSWLIALTAEVFWTGLLGLGVVDDYRAARRRLRGDEA